jgi:uncharacterized protein YjbI with pentapeptide repeats
MSDSENITIEIDNSELHNESEEQINEEPVAYVVSGVVEGEHDEKVEEAVVEEAVVEEAVVEEAVVEDAVVEEAVVEEAVVEDAVVEEAVVEEAVVEEAVVEEAVVEEAVVEEAVVEEAVVEEAVVEEAVVEEAVVEEAVVEDAVVEEAVVEEAVVEDAVVEEAVVEEAVVEEAVVEDAVVEEAVVEEAVVEDAVVEEAVVEEAVVEEAVVEEAVVEEAVVEDAVVEEAVVEEAVVEEAVVEEAVVEEAVVEEAVVEEAVVEEAVVEEADVEEAVVEEAVVEEAVVEEAVPVILKKETSHVPKIIFIVPYRDRAEHQRFFALQMDKVLEDYDKKDYKIIYAHQMDKREFNRGAMKNLGFLYAKAQYPNDYKNITFVFNDVDTMPYGKNFLNYQTTTGVVKHFYGYTFTLGGIVSITGADYERVNGFPNYWAWGYEDNAFNSRVKLAGLTIDRNQFYPILDKNILQLKDGITRIVNRGEYDRYADEIRYQNNTDGLNTLTNITYQYDDNTSFLNINNFQTPISERPELNKLHDMRSGAVPFLQTPVQRRGRPRMGMFF